MRTMLLRGLVVAALTAFYVIAATAHATRVNTFKARGDQSGYLWDAQNVHANWHGRQPPVVIGERNRMPLYAGFLAIFWTPAIADAEFFERAKRWNIYLSVVLLALLWALLRQYLSPLPASNLTLVAAFAYFVFKAGYVQPELLHYFLFFAAFVLCLDLASKRRSPVQLWWRAVAAGAIAALAHLTKAAVLPFVTLFALVFTIVTLLERPRQKAVVRDRLLAVVLLLAAFFAVLSPYLFTNKRVFGHYFYNVNTTFYMWYDDWPQASVGTIKHGDGVGWPDLPPDQLPGARRYWREHTIGQIAGRIAGGLADMVSRSYQTFWYFKYLAVYALVAAAVIRKQPSAFAAAAARHWPAVTFLGLYGAAYLLGIAFYAPISGTGTTRFLLAHVLPLLFVLALLTAREPFSRTEWTIHEARFSLRHVDVAISALLAFDIVFLVWPRLMTTYGGF